MDSFRELKDNVIEVLKLGEELARLQEQLRFVSDIQDKRNYNEELIDRILIRTKEISKRYYYLKDKLDLYN